MSPARPREPLFSTAFKITAGVISGAAALASVLTFARQEGMIGPLATLGSPVAFIRLTPATDTAWSLGDTLHFAVTASDTNGIALTAPLLTWTIANTEVAEARTDGSVIAMGAGETSLIVSAGKAVARAKIMVHPRAVLLRPATDTVELPEGASTSLIAVPFDARGGIIRERLARWTSTDTSVVGVDTLGLATARTPGLATASAVLDGASTRLVVRVTPVLGGLAVQSGNGQHARASTELPASLVIRSLSRQRLPLGGILLRAVPEEGSLEVDTATTGADGTARFRWTLGERPGPQRVVVHAEGIDSVALVTAEADPVPANVRFFLLDSVGSAPAGAALPSPITVRLTDTLGQVLPDVPVRWIGMDGSRIIADAPRTDSLGQVTGNWTLGPKVGINRGRIVAGPGETPALPIATRSLAGPPTRIAILRGNDQRGVVGQPLPARVTFRVTDASGNPTPGVTLLVDKSDGNVTNPSVKTGADGTATLRWAFGAIAGTQRTVVSVQEAPSVKATVSATARPAPAAKVEIVSPSITIVASRSIRVVSAVTDSLGNPISGAVVQYSVTAGSLSTRRATTDAQGRASTTWTLATRQGDQVIRVHAAGVPVDATKTVKRPAR